MKNTILKTIGAMTLAILMLAMFAQVSASAQDKNIEESIFRALQDSSALNESEKKLEGSWNVQSTGRNCQTGAAISTNPSMLTFNYGGTMQEFGTRISPSQRSPGQGVWSQKNARNYTSAFQFFRFNADGTLAGRQIVRQEIELNDSGDEFTSSATAQVLDVNGNVIANNCATGVGTRFE